MLSGAVISGLVVSLTVNKLNLNLNSLLNTKKKKIIVGVTAGVLILGGIGSYALCYFQKILARRMIRAMKSKESLIIQNTGYLKIIVGVTAGVLILGGIGSYALSIGNERDLILTKNHIDA